uniref:Uncharacterized protein n=1 Tax=Anguilla anguilla TaxID=7936 RepID=A0A0E9XHQ0_ANGAN
MFCSLPSLWGEFNLAMMVLFPLLEQHVNKSKSLTTQSKGQSSLVV